MSTIIVVFKHNYHYIVMLSQARRCYTLRKQSIVVIISAGIYLFVISSILTSDFKSTVSTVLSEEHKNYLLPFRSWQENKQIADNNGNRIYDAAGSHSEIKNFRYLFKHRYNKFPIALGKDSYYSYRRGRNNNRYLIYRCDDETMSHCGGITDRFKGMMAAYVIANLTGRIFKAELFSHKCNFNNYFVPNRVNWSLPRTFHKTVQNSTDVQIVNKINDHPFYISVKSKDFNTYWDKNLKYIYFKANLDYMDGFRASVVHHKQLSWMEHLTRDQINSAIFRRLIKLSPHLQYRLDGFMREAVPKPEDKLVCAHVRMGKNPSIPHDYVVRNKPYVLPRVWDFLTLWAAKPNHKIFFTSDSQEVNQWAKSNVSENVMLIPGDIYHIERTEDVPNNYICRAQEKAILEQFILMHCDVLMISKSGFSRLAAYVRGSNEDLHCLVGMDVIPCKLDNLKELYSEIG